MFEKLLALFVVFFVVPFFLGMFPRGSEWLMRPTMYLNLYLLRVADWGSKTKEFVSSKLK